MEQSEIDSAVATIGVRIERCRVLRFAGEIRELSLESAEAGDSLHDDILHLVERSETQDQRTASAKDKGLRCVVVSDVHSDLLRQRHQNLLDLATLSTAAERRTDRVDFYFWRMLGWILLKRRQELLMLAFRTEHLIDRARDQSEFV